MGSRLVPKSVTLKLNQLERRNDRYVAFFAVLGSFAADYVIVFDDRRTRSAREM